MANGFFTDTTLCIGCKACEVACKQWNQLPADGYAMTGMSYDNTVALSATTWRHVAFVEEMAVKPKLPMAYNTTAPRATPAADGGSPGGFKLVDVNGGASLQVGFPDTSRWLMMSDVCKHCTNAGCLQACPTGAIVHTEFGSVYVQPDICNGCGYCVPSCPFGVVALQEDDGRAFKCTLCYDRQKEGLEPACAKACPTDSIIFGELESLKKIARQRVASLHEEGATEAYLYGVDENTEVGDLNAFFLLTAPPETYGLPQKPFLPQNRVKDGYIASALMGVALSVGAGLLALWRKSA
ncbi:MAG TPA: 4Fe-4S dicluster domain-containing protein [Chloroflexia bacterium]|nr:4Fe-4S dicluster domain-containing protein [Chloroflexia bacterium]